MARINVKEEWYEQVEPSTFSEGEFEQRVTLHAPSVYPLYHVLPFKKAVKAPSDETNKGYEEVIPDLIFISKDYEDWWVCELEMGYHSFKSHVQPQVDKLLRADYGMDEVEYLCDKNDNLDKDKLYRLFQNSPARVIVIVNQHVPKWVYKWPDGRVVYAVFELFRSYNSDEIFRVNGDYPCFLKDKISKCLFHPIVPRLLHIVEPEKLEIPKRAIIQLIFNNCVTEWRRIDEGDKVYLTSVSRYPLKPNNLYSIYLRNDDQLVLQCDLFIEEEDL